jgi:hypothetical protein
MRCKQEIRWSSLFDSVRSKFKNITILLREITSLLLLGFLDVYVSQSNPLAAMPIENPKVGNSNPREAQSFSVKFSQS